MGDSDNISETTQVAAVTRLKSGPDQLEDLLRRLLTAVDTPAPIPEVPVVENLLQRLVAETQSHPPPVMSHPESVGLEIMLRSFQPEGAPRQQRKGAEAASSTATRPTGLERSDVFLMWIVPPHRITNNDVSDTPELSGNIQDYCYY